MPITPQALALLIESHGAVLQIWTRSRTNHWEDVVQEAFCRLAVHHPAPEHPPSWLFTVCKNLAEKANVSHYRRIKRENVKAIPEAFESDPGKALEQAETIAGLEVLEKTLKEILIAKIWGGLSFEEIGRLMGFSTATAFRRYETALKQLRETMVLQSERNQ
jgi:RNA polymerase sigma-70 factor (ECF subfamily)